VRPWNQWRCSGRIAADPAQAASTCSQMPYLRLSKWAGATKQQSNRCSSRPTVAADKWGNCGSDVAFQESDRASIGTLKQQEAQISNQYAVPRQ